MKQVICNLQRIGKCPYPSGIASMRICGHGVMHKRNKWCKDHGPGWCQRAHTCEIPAMQPYEEAKESKL